MKKAITTEEELDERLSRPYPDEIELAGRLNGDVLVLGAGGKMGPTLVRRIVRAVDLAGSKTEVYAVSRFSDQSVARSIMASGASVIRADVLNEGELVALPDCAHVIYLIGSKFGTTGEESHTWAINTYLPGRFAETFRDAHIVALSTGNVYPFVSPSSGGSKEEDNPYPVGEYAQSCLGRERILQHFSGKNGTKMCLLRLNYAVELRYGVLLDVGQKVFTGTPVSLDTGFVNVIWQGDANAAIYRALEYVSCPPRILNVTGGDILSVRSLAESFAVHFGRQVVFTGEEKSTALLSDTGVCHELMGAPHVTVDEMVGRVAHWIKTGGRTLDKPTKFEVRDGRF